MHASLTTLPAISWLPAGTGWIALAAIALGLQRADRTLPWRWLGVFAAAQTLDAWLGLAGLASASAGAAAIARSALGIAGGLALLEFARGGWNATARRPLPAGALLAPAALALVAALAHWSWPLDGSGAWLLMLASVGAALVLRSRSRERRGPAATGLAAASALFLLYAAGLALGGASATVGLALLMLQAAALLIPAALVAFVLWAPDAATGRGPAYVRGALLISAVLLTALTLGLGSSLQARYATEEAVRAATPGGAALPGRAIPFATGLVVAAIYYGLVTAWHSAVAWAKRMQRQDADLLGPIVEATRDGLIVVDEVGDVVFRNSHFALMWNVPEDQLEQRDAGRLWEVLLEQLADADGFRATWRNAQGSRGEYRDLVHFKDGRVVQVYSCPMPSDSEIAGRAWSFKDITGVTGAEVERRNQQIRLQRESDALARLARRRLSQSGDLEAALREITKTASDTLSIEFVSAWLLDAEGIEIECLDAYARTPDRHDGGHTQPAEQIPQFLAALEAEGRALVIDDAAQDSRASDLYARQLAPQQISALLAAPIRLDGETIGYILCAHQGSARTWAADEAHFVASLADHAAQAVERDEHRLTEQALHRIQELQQLIIDTAAGAVFLTDAQGRITAVNGAFSVLTGFMPEELVGRSHAMLASSECGADCPLQHPAAEIGRVQQHACHILDREGRAHAARLNAAPVYDPSGTLLGMVVSYADVSEVVHAREQIDELLGELETAREAERDAHTARTPSETGTAELAELAELRAARETWVAETQSRDAREAQLEHGRAEARRALVMAEEAQAAAQRSLEKTRRDADATAERLRQALERAEARERELAEARRERQASDQELAEARREHQAADREMEAIRLELRSASEQLAEAQQGLTATGEELASVRRQLAATRSDLAAARQSLAEETGPRSTQVDALGERLARLQADLEAERERAGSIERALEEERASGERKARELERSAQDAQLRLREARADAGAAAEKIAVLLDRQRQGEAEQRALREQLEREREELEGVREQLEREREELAAQRAAAGEMADRDRATEAEVAALRADAAAVRGELSGARQELAARTSEISALGEQLARVREDFERARERATGAESEQSALREELTALQAERRDREVEAQAARQKATALETELREARAALDRLMRAAAEQATVHRAQAPRSGPAADVSPLLRVLPPRPARRGSSPAPAPEPVTSDAGSSVVEGRPFDAQALLERVGGDRQLAAGRARAFQKGSTWMVACLRQALERRDPRALLGAARSLRGALGDVAAEEAQRLAEELEEMGRRKDLGGAPKVMKTLETELDRVRSALANFSRAA